MNWEEYKAFHAKVEVTPRHLNGSLELNQMLHCAMGLSGESAEVLEIVKKFMYGKKVIPDPARLKDELSDVFWYLALGLRALDIDLEELMAYNAAKLTDRYPELLEEPKQLVLKPGEIWSNPSGTAYIFNLGGQ